MTARQKADKFDRFQVNPTKRKDERWKVVNRGNLSDCYAFIKLAELNILNY